MIPKVTDHINVVVASIQAKTKRSSESSKQDLAYAAAMMLYVSKMHETAMAAWKKFGETTEQVGDKGDAAHKARQLRHAELEGQKKNVEFQKQGEESYVHRQAAAFHSLEGETTGNHLSHRHLCHAV